MDTFFYGRVTDCSLRALLEVESARRKEVYEPKEITVLVAALEKTTD